MTHVFHRQTKAVPPTAKRGDGVYVVDAAGKRYLDASGGAAVSCLGHSEGMSRAVLKFALQALLVDEAMRQRPAVQGRG